VRLRTSGHYPCHQGGGEPLPSDSRSNGCAGGRLANRVAVDGVEQRESIGRLLQGQTRACRGGEIWVGSQVVTTSVAELAEILKSAADLS
jgi:hypothetical protein